MTINVINYYLELESSRLGCKSYCILPYEHSKKEKCICSAKLEEHICNGKCSLKLKSREGCNFLCSLNKSKDHVCICDNPKEKHICKTAYFLEMAAQQ